MLGHCSNIFDEAAERLTSLEIKARVLAKQKDLRSLAEADAQVVQGLLATTVATLKSDIADSLSSFRDQIIDPPLADAVPLPTFGRDSQRGPAITTVHTLSKK